MEENRNIVSVELTTEEKIEAIKRFLEEKHRAIFIYAKTEDGKARLIDIVP